MKKLQNILAAALCTSMLFGCQYTGDLYNKYGHPHIPVQTQHIPSQQSNQINKQQPPADQAQAPEMAALPPVSIKIALLAPLSGSYKDLGKGLLDAAQLAVFRIGDERITIVPIDTGDSASGAVDAAKKAVDEGAKIILGPVFSSSAKAIAKIASDNNIPVISFSNDKTLAGTGVFAVGLLPEQQIKRMIDFSSAHGIKEFIALLPSDAYGTAMTNQLKQIGENNHDITILKNEYYQTDSQGRAIGLDGHVQSLINAAKGKGSAPVGVILPSSSGVTNAVLTYLNQNNFDKSKIQLLGSDAFNNDSMLRNPALEGAMFTASPSDRRIDFENKFRSTYSHDAPKIASLAYDGVALTATLAKIGGGENFSRDLITSSRGFVGVDGIFRLRSDGLTERGFSVMSVKNGRAIVIDPAPKSFSEGR